MGKFAQVIKWTAIGAVGLVVLAMLVAALAAWQASRQFDRTVADLRTAGQPASIADLAPEPVPADEDAAVLLAKVTTDAAAFVDQAYKIYRPGHADPSDEQLAAVRELMADYEHIFPAIHEASLRPDYRSQADYSQPYESFLESQSLRTTRQPRSIARALRLRTDVLLADGKHDEAIQGAIDSLRLSRKWDQEPMIVGYLTSLACREITVDMVNRTLRSGRLSDQTRKALEIELASHDDMSGFQSALQTERAYGLDAYRHLTKESAWVPAISMWWLTPSAVAMADQTDQICGAADRLWFETKQQRAEMKATASEHTMVELAWPAVDAMWSARDRVRSHLRCLRILNALQAYEERHGRDPVELAELGLPADATIDPFTGDPLKWKKTDAGWLIYSVGRDGVDDGGRTDSITDYGVAPIGWEPPGEDVVADETEDVDQTDAP